MPQLLFTFQNYSSEEGQNLVLFYYFADPEARLKKVNLSQMVRNPPAMWDTWVQSLGWEDPLEEGMATHSSIPDWRIPWTEEPGRLQSGGVSKSLTQPSD